MSERQYELGPRYEFESVLGRGGMGVVLRARDTVLNRPVAIKLLSDELSHVPEAQEIFLTEGRAMASLKHPNMVSVFDVVDTGSKAMMVFEFVDGNNFDDLRRVQKRIDPAVVVSSAIQLCEALTYLHENGYIHRDLKPANVMIQDDGKVKLIDFGLARSLEAILERGTRVRGSPAYMSPEQFTGDELSAASDIYALGVTLFELLSGQVPFVDGDKGFAHVHKAPPKLAEKVEGLHPRLYDLVDQCLEKAPSDRPKSAKEVIRILSEVRGSEDQPQTLVDVGPTTSVVWSATTASPSEFEPIEREYGLGKLLIVAGLVFGLVGLALAFTRQKEESLPIQEDSASVEVVEAPNAPVEVSTKPDAVEPVKDAVEPVKNILALALVIGEKATVTDLRDAVEPVREPRPARKATPPKTTNNSNVGPLESPPDSRDDQEAAAKPAEAIVELPDPELKLPNPELKPVVVVEPIAAESPKTTKSQAKKSPPEKKETVKKEAVPKKTAPKEDKPTEVFWSF